MNNSCDIGKLNKIIKSFGGLSAGKHLRKDACCILEAYSQCINREWTDDPYILNTWDIRPLNDMHVSTKLRTEWMVKVMEAYKNCRDWPMEKQKKVVENIVIEIVKQIIGDLPNLPSETISMCKSVDDANAARAAAANASYAAVRANVHNVANAADCVVYAARAAAAAAADAADAAYAAADAVSYAAYAAADDTASSFAAAATVIFVKACKIWLNAVNVR